MIAGFCLIVIDFSFSFPIKVTFLKVGFLLRHGNLLYKRVYEETFVPFGGCCIYHVPNKKKIENIFTFLNIFFISF